MTAPTISLVVPCYNEEEVLPETAKQLMAVLDGLVASGTGSSASHVIFVDDGSKDKTWSIIHEFSKNEPRIRGLKLSRNRGHQNALLAGLHRATGDAVISVDADLQDDLTVIPLMVQAMLAGSDIVFGVRDDRTSDTMFKRFSAQSYYRVLHMLGVDVVYNHADYRLMSRRAIEALREFREVNLFLRGIIPLLGFRTSIVPYQRHERFAGESKYPLRKMIALAINGVTSFSAAPLRMITVIGIVTSMGAAAITVWALYVSLVVGDVIPGWTSIVVPLMAIGGLQLFATGVTGEYVARIYLETKRRPAYLIETDTGAERFPIPANAHD